MKNKDWNEGFTLVETLVAVLITVSVSGAILFGISKGIKIYRQIESEVQINREVNLMVCYAEKVLEKIRIPFWEQNTGQLSGDGEILGIPYYEGVKENRVEIQLYKNGLLLIEPGKEPILFSNLNKGNLYWFYKEKQIAGINIMLDLKSSPITLLVPFGAVPIRNEVHP